VTYDLCLPIVTCSFYCSLWLFHMSFATFVISKPKSSQLASFLTLKKVGSCYSNCRSVWPRVSTSVNLPFIFSECGNPSRLQRREEGNQCVNFLSSMSMHAVLFTSPCLLGIHIATEIKLLQRPAPHFPRHPSLVYALLFPSLQHVDSVLTDRSASQ
jgi:hypothetical protein